MPGYIRVALLVPAGLLLLATPVAAQLKLGDFSNTLNGNVSSGYTADFGNQTSSDHGWTAGGTTNLGGSFYSPNFLNYAASIYLNQSRANSAFQSISDSSGVSLATNIFGGSRFPGAITYSKSFDSEGNYGIPGTPNYVTHGDNGEFGINWGLNLPNAPSLSAGFQLGTDTYSVYGSNDQGNSTFHSLNLHSSYVLQGFNMTGTYTLGGNNSLVPEVVSGESNTQIHSSSDGFGFGISHSLPLHGSVTASASRSSFNTEAAGSTETGTVDLFNLVGAIIPAQKLTISGNFDYSDNLAGQLAEAVVSAGGAVPASLADQTSYSVDAQVTMTYLVSEAIQTSLYAERRDQYYLDEDYSANSYGGSGTFTHRLGSGTFSSSLLLAANTAAQQGADSLSFAASAHYSGEVEGWVFNGAASYAQNMATLLVADMNSTYDFSASAHRRIRQFTVSAGGSSARTALTGQSGTTSSSESYNASLGYTSLIDATGSYSKSSGLALATGAGLVSLPIPSPTLPSDLVALYGGTSYSGALSSVPVKGLSLSAGYSRSNTDTSDNGTSSSNQNEQYSALVQYRVRKMGFTSGYARLEQGFGGSASSAQTVSSFYMGITRWFNFF
ncbi:MAG: hypothetical protein ABR928_07740 [Terracidiphilus sp.]